MTTLSHSNFALHRLLTDQGACTHQHEPDSFEDDGDGESGPHLTGGPAFDRYSSESHEIIVDSSGKVVHSEAIDWDFYRFCEVMMADSDTGQRWPEDEYKRARKTGEDWQVSYRDEDGSWYACHGYGWTDDPHSAAFFSKSEAEQVAARFNLASHDWICGPAKIVDRRKYASADDAYAVLREAGYKWDPMAHGHWINQETGESAKVRANAAPHGYSIAWLGR